MILGTSIGLERFYLKIDAKDPDDTNIRDVDPLGPEKHGGREYGGTISRRISFSRDIKFKVGGEVMQEGPGGSSGRIGDNNSLPITLPLPCTVSFPWRYQY